MPAGENLTSATTEFKVTLGHSQMVTWGGYNFA